MSTRGPASGSLRERKRQEVKGRIVEAAFALFLEHGFDAVTVDEIAQRADVGRATFFRYFGDKQEVVFVRDLGMDLELPNEASRIRDAPETDTGDLAAAMVTARHEVTAFCREATADPGHHATYHLLVERHPELADRHARKVRGYVDALETRLLAEGFSEATACLAAQLALAVYQTAWRLAAGNATALLREAETAFDALEERGRL